MCGEALWEEELSLVCTMFVNPKTGTYEPKPAVFVVKEILDAPLKERVYAEATIDLLEFAMQPGRTVKRTLPLILGKKTLPTHLVFSIKATPLREGVALSEVSSDMSVADLADVADADAVIAAEQEEDEGDKDSEVGEITAVTQQQFAIHQQQQQTTETRVMTTNDVYEEVTYHEETVEEGQEEFMEEVTTTRRTKAGPDTASSDCLLVAVHLYTTAAAAGLLVAGSCFHVSPKRMLKLS